MRLARLLIEAGYTPAITLFQQRIRSLKSLCRIRINSYWNLKRKEILNLLFSKHLINYLLYKNIKGK